MVSVQGETVPDGNKCQILQNEQMNIWQFRLEINVVVFLVALRNEDQILRQHILQEIQRITT